MDYIKAKEIAEQIKSSLEDICKKIEIVGSVKRGDKTTVHDIEILLVPQPGAPRPVFGRPTIFKTFLDSRLADLEYHGQIRQAANKKDGDKYKKRAIVGTGELNEFCLDIFIVTDQTWGIQNVIRTGPSLFSHRYVTNKNITFFSTQQNRIFNGLLPNDLQYIRGETQIKRGSEVLQLPSERAAIEILGCGWIDPADRGIFALTKEIK